ncbi:MAG: arginine--tRNA ligase [Cellvibrionales bacterium TMED148]|nr:arginine--tRNA ligase [Porticoccaceae bacterium]RPG89135.1 MAG: arginine--tRNA ligase [Cellvibrionales bacterium TMED148]
MTISSILESRLGEAMRSLDLPTDCSPVLKPSTNPKFGDYQANGVMAAAKLLGKNPHQLAKSILDKADLAGIACKTDIAGPGFINIEIDTNFLDELLNHDETETLRQQDNETVVIDYSAPNLAKEMHVGHLRSTIIGDCIARVLEYRGNTVIRQNHMGDWGTQFGMLVAELESHLGAGEKAELALTDLESFYQKAKKHFDEDPEFADHARTFVVRLQSGDPHSRRLWKQFIDVSIAHNLEIYKQLNVSLTLKDVKPESAYNDQLEPIVEKLMRLDIAKDDQGAKVIFIDALANKKGEPSAMIIRKSDGGFLYATTDLAALQYRSKDLKANRILYFIDARQSLHMQQVFHAGRLAELVPPDVSLEHHAFGTMMGQDGKPFKTRTGGTIKLARLIDEAIARAEKLVKSKNLSLSEPRVKAIAQKVAIGAIKYADLSKTRTHDYIFDWDGMISFDGNTAPYLQYAYTRINSIFKRADLDLEDHSSVIIITEATEKKLALKLLQFEEIIEQVSVDCYPHVLCNYLYELASVFMSFYEQCPILRQDISTAKKNSRLELAKLTANRLASGLDLLGIEVMSAM